MSSPLDTESAPRTRAVLSREAIVAAAAELVDEAGQDALTMRAVADRLGSGVMSLYRHVADREELLDLVLEVMVGELPMTPATGRWREDLTAIAADIRAGLLRRPHLTVLLTSRTGLGGAALPRLEHTMAVLRTAGFTPVEAALVNHALGNYVAGAALWEAVGLAGTSGHVRAERRRALGDSLADVPADQFPNLYWLGRAVVAGTLDDRFEFGLACLLDGFERLLAAPGREA